MPLSLDQFRTRLVASSLLTEGDVEGLLSSLTEVDQPADGEAFAKRLVRDGLLTAWQAKQVYRGRSKSLVLGNYVLLDKLGQGGMGMVFKAEHLVMKRIVAVKTLSSEITKSSTLVARFRREVQVAARLDHPNIVTAFDAANEGAIQYLVMQYVDGEDLSALVRRQGALPVSKALDCMRQAATGLQYAHEQGVIHRDIKPSNLLLDRSGTVKVLDMGLARFEGLDEKSSELTATGAVMGTIDYMAPEQAEDTHQADARADIYSLGCSLFYLLTGQPAFGGNTAIKRILAHREAVIPSLTTYVSEATPQLNALFQDMVAKRPEDRIQTMAQVCERLEQLGTDHTSVRVKSIISEDSKLDDFLKSMDSESSTENDSDAATQVTRVQSRTAGAKTSDDDFFELNEDFATSAVPSKESKSKRSLTSTLNIKATGIALVAVLSFVIYLVFSSGNEGENEESTPVVDSPIVDAPRGAEAFPERSPDSSGERPEPPRSMATDPATTGLFFDGENDYAVAPDFQFDDASPATIEVWLTCTNPRGVANPVMVLGEHWMAVFHIDNDWGVGKLNGMSTEMFMFPQSLQRNSPTHVASVWDGETARIFVNGDEPSTPTPNSFQLSPTSEGLYIGGVPVELLTSGEEGGRFFEGVIHQIRISNNARYPRSFTPERTLENDSNTIGLFHLDEVTDNEIRDLSGNNRHGTIHGAAWETNVTESGDE